MKKSAPGASSGVAQFAAGARCSGSADLDSLRWVMPRRSALLATRRLPRQRKNYQPDARRSPI
jgi:hypothetical protein